MCICILETYELYCDLLFFINMMNIHRTHYFISFGNFVSEKATTYNLFTRSKDIEWRLCYFLLVWSPFTICPIVLVSGSNWKNQAHYQRQKGSYCIEEEWLIAIRKMVFDAIKNRTLNMSLQILPANPHLGK